MAFYALLASINRYGNEHMPPLQFAERDGEVLQQLLTERGYKAVHLAGKNATREGILNILSGNVAPLGWPALRPEDTFLFFFAGHGELVGGSYVLHAHGARPGNAIHSVPVRDIAHSLKESLPCLHAACIIDACRNLARPGARGVAGLDAQSTRDIKAVASGTDSQKLVAMLYGCDEGQVSLEHDSLGHGVLTYHLAEVFRERTCSTIEDIFDEASDRMRAWGLKTQGVFPQEPQLYRPGGRRRIVLFNERVPSDRPGSQLPPLQSLNTISTISSSSTNEIRSENASTSVGKGSDSFFCISRDSDSFIGGMPLVLKAIANISDTPHSEPVIQPVPYREPVEAPVPSELADLHRKAKAGDAASMFSLAWALDRDNDAASVPPDEAACAYWYRKAADAGNADAINNLGLMYKTGLGVKQDDAEVVRLYRKAADAGHAHAIANLGVMYETGRGVKQDDAEAVRLYRKAADAGNASAMNNLGVMCETGRGVKQDDAEAVRLYRKAADAGNAGGMGSLGWAYVQGQGGLPKDRAKGIDLLRSALAGGFTWAGDRLKELSEKP